MQILVFVLIAALVGLGIWYSYYRKRQRRLDLATFARQYQLEYSQVDGVGLIGYPFHLFSRGDGRGCENLLEGQWQGLPMREADSGTTAGHRTWGAAGRRPITTS